MIKYLEIIKKYSDLCMCKTLDGENIESKSYSDYLSDVRKCAYLLEKHSGVVEGKHIGIIARSGYEYYVLFAAVIFSRAVVVPINENETENNISFAIKNAEVDILLVEDKPEKYSKDNALVLKKDLLFEKTENEKDLKDFSEEEADNMAVILYTSGTTSLAKGVVLSVDNVFHDCLYILPKRYNDNRSAAHGTKVYTNFPCYHVGGLIAWLSFTENGCTICYSKDLKNILSDLENIEIDFAAVTPTVLKLWVNCVKRNRMDRMGMVKDILSGGALIEPDMVRFFNSNGITVGQFYGQTEVGGAVIQNLDMENHVNSIGKVAEGATIKIIDGEICIEYWGNMQGYYKNPEETEKCLKDGVVYSGDLGYMDDEGYVYITGRKKNLIILSGGENVSPEEIETKIYENLHIKECMVYEKNDSIYADIYAPDLSETEVREYIKEINKTMPLYKRVKHVEYKESELEKTSIGKIKR
ncbi:class I adenylate-forming enzyme family protein [Butyrivibrio sp. AE3006]|uniref:class I adenylate-forming enzyme family protein n=1 Tax=Butyrivibrio sp. AE3006 TaxID=1280673 RepID=UPI0003FE3DCF|nr:class I adenylate-forming enzyme family protein [Butyrivibrio sp. AE3006]